MNKNAGLFFLCLFAYFLAACNSTISTNEIRTTMLDDYQIVDSDGNQLANLADVVLDGESGQISYAILTLERSAFHYSKAAFVPGSGSYTAVPWTYLSIDKTNQALQLSVDRSILFAAPQLVKLPETLKEDWDTQIQAYWQAFEPNPS